MKKTSFSLLLLAVFMCGCACTEKTFKAGCAEKELEVPLFSELYGYGHFVGRRNLKVVEPLYCRGYSFNDGSKRALIIYSDVCSVSKKFIVEMRHKLADKFDLDPQYITFVSTHTHSAPAVGYKKYGVASSGVPDPEFQKIWKDAVMEVAAKALKDEETIACVEAGRAPVIEKFSRNRVERQKNFTDPDIRWAKFIRPDGSCKILLHSSGAHPIAMNGAGFKLASSDWPGAVNRSIKEAKLADMPFFMLGPCGDTNAWPTNLDLPKPGLTNAPDVIAQKYMKSLNAGLAKGGEKLTSLDLKSKLVPVEVPQIKMNAAELRVTAEKLRKRGEYEAERANRLDEMAILVDKGVDLTLKLDFQVLRIGELSFLFIPGEYYIENAVDMMSKSISKYPFAVTLANDDGCYMPSEKIMKKYPSVDSPRKDLFGFYDIYCHPNLFQFRYGDNIADFVAQTLLGIEKEISK